MAKKKQGKKHKFKYSTPAVPGQSGTVGVDLPKRAATARVQPGIHARTPVAASGPSRDFSYVGADLRRIGILAACLVALELVIWFVFGHTGVGNAVYQMVQA
jgi:hypothetical protein